MICDDHTCNSCKYFTCYIRFHIVSYDKSSLYIADSFFLHYHTMHLGASPHSQLSSCLNQWYYDMQFHFLVGWFNAIGETMSFTPYICYVILCGRPLWIQNLIYTKSETKTGDLQSLQTQSWFLILTISLVSENIQQSKLGQNYCFPFCALYFLSISRLAVKASKTFNPTFQNYFLSRSMQDDSVRILPAR